MGSLVGAVSTSTRDRPDKGEPQRESQADDPELCPWAGWARRSLSFWVRAGPLGSPSLGAWKAPLSTLQPP